MPSYFSPGVYVEEVPGGARPIGPVGTSTAGFVGVAPNPDAPVNKAIAVNNWTQFLRYFVAEGSTESTPSLVLMSKTDESIETMLVRLRCESITPLGRPVVPEVKISEARDWAVTRLGKRAIRSSSVNSSGKAKTSSNVHIGTWRFASANIVASSGCSSVIFWLRIIPAASPARAKLTISAVELSGSTGMQLAPAFSTPK